MRALRPRPRESIHPAPHRPAPTARGSLHVQPLRNYSFPSSVLFIIQYIYAFVKRLDIIFLEIFATQGELAKLLCGKKSLVSNYENGYSTPDIYTLCRLADIFGITLDELVEWESD